MILIPLSLSVLILLAYLALFPKINRSERAWKFLIAKCSFLLCNDLFFLHAAGALNVPVVAIFGPASPDKRLPFNNISRGVWPSEGCRGCIERKSNPQLSGTNCVKPSIECMHAIKPEEVIENIDITISKILKNRNIEVESYKHKISKNV